MNIGILTFTGTSNFGAALQAYALQQVIMAKGHNCEIIRYECKKIKNDHDPKRAFKYKGIKKIFSPFYYFSYKKRMDTFEKFNKTFCKFSEKCDKSTIKVFAQKYDKIIVGSDQVWNPEISGNDLSYFLDFVDDSKKKCSYAASIGMDYFTDNCKLYEELLAKFNIISVREQNTVDNLEKQIGRKDITCDVDPTILLSNKWVEFVLPSTKTKDYIFMYFTPNSNAYITAVKDFASKNNCEIIELTKSMRKHGGVKRVSNASPIDFINYIAHAKYVITGSFHALCFSIMFKKEFYITSSPFKERNGRLIQFATNLGLKNRILAENYEIKKMGIDYDMIHAEIDKQRNMSLITINRILNE